MYLPSLSSSCLMRCYCCCVCCSCGPLLLPLPVCPGSACHGRQWLRRGSRGAWKSRLQVVAADRGPGCSAWPNAGEDLADIGTQLAAPRPYQLPRQPEVPRCCRMRAGPCSGRWQKRPAGQQPKCGWHWHFAISVSLSLFRDFSSRDVFMNTMHMHARSPQKSKSYEPTRHEKRTGTRDNEAQPARRLARLFLSTE